MSFAANSEGGEENSPEPTDTSTLAPEVQQLLDMLRYRRPHDSVTETEWVDKFIMPLDPVVLRTNTGSISGYCIEVPEADGTASKVMFSSHVDTVHHMPGMQEVKFDSFMMVAYKADNMPLGADDAAGVWLMLQMIEAKVPGWYLFHRGEEKGGIGSKAISRDHQWLFEGITAAVAFDRKADCSIITHQRCDRCCSDAFATALGARLTARMPHDGSSRPRYTLAPDDGGVYTDTAEYTDLVGECTNVSVGYIDEHSGKEMLDVEYLLALRDACIDPQVWVDLPSVRKPGEHEAYSWSGFGGRSSSRLGTVYDWPDDYPSLPPRRPAGAKVLAFDREKDKSLSADEIASMKRHQLVEWVAEAGVQDIVDTLYGLADCMADMQDEYDELEDRFTAIEYLYEQARFERDEEDAT